MAGGENETPVPQLSINPRVGGGLETGEEMERDKHTKVMCSQNQRNYLS